MSNQICADVNKKFELACLSEIIISSFVFCKQYLFILNFVRNLTSLIMDPVSPVDPAVEKKTRKRVANFTADEKALLAQLVKRHAIVESKLTDGKSVDKKKSAWHSITTDFNCSHNVTKRDTNTLKRSWDNMKAATRKARSVERGNLIRTGGGPNIPPQPPQQVALISMVEEAAPVIICEIKNSFDSDGIILNKPSKEMLELCTDTDIGYLPCPSHQNEEIPTACTSSEPKNIQEIDNVNQDGSIEIEQDVPMPAGASTRRPIDYVRREAVLRIKHFEAKKKMEMQILKTKLEVQEIKKRAAIFEEERSKIYLEKAKLELNEIKDRLEK